MSALAHYLEDEGLATTLISLVRQHSEVMRPPRALWVPYELGRPLGPPNDPALQREILTAALDLLVSDQGPVVHVDFERDLPPESDWRCPFETRADGSLPEDPAEAARLLKDECREFARWYPRAVKRFGRTTVGLANLPADVVPDHVAAGYVALAQGEALPASPIRGLHRMQALRFAIDDLKACYMEAAVADGARPSRRQHNTWFWDRTAAGQLVKRIREHCLRSDEALVKRFGQSFLVPREFL